MLVAGWLAHALRGARQRVACSRELAAAAAAWQQLHAGEQGGSAGGFGSSSRSGSHSWLSGASNGGGASFSSSAVHSGSKQASSIDSSGSAAQRAQPRGADGRFISLTPEPQPQLQAWLQQVQSLPRAEADQYAWRLARVFDSQQAALDSLPAAFEWCRSRGLTSLQTAQLLDRITKKRQENVVQFATLVQPVWQLLDSHIAAYIEQQRQAGDAKLRKHSSLAEVLCSSSEAAKALGMPLGHVEAWLAAVSKRLPAAAIGRLLLSNPVVATGSPSTAEAALDWAADVLRVTDPAAFFAGAASLLNSNASTLQRNFDSLQQALGCTAEQARRLALKQPVILSSSPGTVRAALTWLRQRFTDAEQLADVVDRGSRLLSCSEQHLQGNADYLHQALGWQDGGGQLEAFLAAYPYNYATVSLSSQEMEHKLQLLSEVVGVSRQECLTGGISYLSKQLDNIAARYMLVQERALELLRNKAGELRLSWITDANKPPYLRRLGLTRPEFNAFVHTWPASEEGRRLLEGLSRFSLKFGPTAGRELCQATRDASSSADRQAEERALTAATAAWQQLHVGEQGGSAGGFGGSGSSGSHSLLSGASNGGCASFSSSAFSNRGAASNMGSSGGGASFSNSAFCSRGAASNMGSTSDGSDKGHCKRGRPTGTSESQPQLQTWLQQQGLSEAEADLHARRLAHIFGSQQAALGGLPATFEWCRSRGLAGPQTAQLLDRIAKQRQDNVVQFAATAQHDWLLIDTHIAAHVEQLRRTGAKLPKHTSLAEAVCSYAAAAQALGMPPGHVEAWLTGVSQRLPAAAIGKLLCSAPILVTGSPTTALAAISWAADVLGVTDATAFFRQAPLLLKSEAATLQRNFDSLQQGLGCTAEQARRLAVRKPAILGSSPATVQAALAWLRQLFPDAGHLADVIDRGPQLLSASVRHLQGNADTLQQALGLQDGDGQLAAFVATYPQPFAINNLSSDGTADKLWFLTHVVGICLESCLSKGASYLKTKLETMAAHYMLVQGRAPHLLFSRAGQLQLSWISDAVKPRYLNAMGMTRPQFNAFVRQWPRSEEGQRLLEGLRAGSVEGWPCPISPEEAVQRHAAAAELRRQGRAARL